MAQYESSSGLPQLHIFPLACSHAQFDQHPAHELVDDQGDPSAGEAPSHIGDKHKGGEISHAEHTHSGGDEGPHGVPRAAQATR